MRKNSNRSAAGSDFTVGIDLGGTKVAVGLVDAWGKVIASAVRPTVPVELAELDPRVLIARPPSPSHVRRHIRYVTQVIADAVEDVVLDAGLEKSARLSGIGLASAGPMNLLKGTLNHPANFRGWGVVPLVKLLENELAKTLTSQTLKMWKSRRIHFQNDAIAAALGEGWIGRAKGCQTYVMITVGTGIGTGVIFNGKPAQSRGMGSEWGHMIVDSQGLGMLTGKMKDRLGFREVEGHASGTWLVRRAREAGENFETASSIALAALANEELPLELFAGAANGLAALLCNLSLGFAPECFVFGGGLMVLKDMFFPQAVKLYREMIKSKNPAFLAKVYVSSLGDQAGVIGAARLPRIT